MTKPFLLSIFLLISFYVIGQKDLKTAGEEILQEGLNLYKLERAAWLASDSLSSFSDYSTISGYVSFFDAETLKVIFYEIKEEGYFVHYTIEFDTTLNTELLNINTTLRPVEGEEEMYIDLREGTFDILDIFEEEYGKIKDTGKNVAIIKEDNFYKIFAMTGSTTFHLLPIGNDFRFECKVGESVIEFKEAIHQLYTPISTVDIPQGTNASMHTHSKSSSDFISSTDICTLLLYKEIFPLKIHYTVSEKYISVFNNETLKLSIMLKDEFNEKYNMKL